MRFAVLLLSAVALTGTTAIAAPPPAWVARSNEHARIALDALGKFGPESAAQLGLDGYDEGIVDLGPNLEDRVARVNQQVLAELRKRRAAEKDPLVQQDLDIMIESTRESIQSAELRRKYQLPYLNLTQVVFGGIRALLDDQVAEKRRPAALVRLRKYAGLLPGTTPLATLAEQRTRERLNTPGLLGPPRDQVEKDLKNASFFLDGLDQLFQKYNIAGYQEPLAKLKQQLIAYNEFVSKEVLPKARTDFRLPTELYADALRNYGVDIPPAQLAGVAHKAFDDLQRQANVVAMKVAKEKGITGAKDYRDVIRELKKDQLTSGQIVDHYRTRIAQIEDIVRKQNLVTLPDRPARMRLASAAESAGQPAPNMRPPRMIGNTGETGEFVLPLNNPAAGNARTDDFTFAAASWTLSCHEARPGHEMQFSKMMEAGVSTARAVFVQYSG